MWIDTLTREQCVDVLGRNHVARLACARDGQPYVVPVSYAFAENYLYGMSTPGRKIDWMRSNPLVCVEVHERVGDRGWRSVVVDGLFEELSDTPRRQHEREFAWSLLSRQANWWEPGGLELDPAGLAPATPHLFYWIRIDVMTGRSAVDTAAP